ncbi:MAG TPA: hypothetical protein VM914_10480 [Pyrinomonadaceae bacterium]|jgi:uncharacterized membrane protein YagU involved in acid resistance|nr:hypothetical protein [Pyrinomonadaceae bacterium]
MVAASEAFPADRPSAASAILWGGLIAGAIDITYACVFSYARRGVPPGRILQSVASGALGDAAFQGGTTAAALGLLLHFIIALIWAAVYYLASRKLRVLASAPYVCGIVYGLLIFAAMNYVVIPLSAAPFGAPPPSSPAFGTGLLVHMLGIGLPIALATRRFSRGDLK